MKYAYIFLTQLESTADYDNHQNTFGNHITTYSGDEVEEWTGSYGDVHSEAIIQASTAVITYSYITFELPTRFTKFRSEFTYLDTDHPNNYHKVGGGEIAYIRHPDDGDLQSSDWRALNDIPGIIQSTTGQETWEDLINTFATVAQVTRDTANDPSDYDGLSDEQIVELWFSTTQPKRVNGLLLNEIQTLDLDSKNKVKVKNENQLVQDTVAAYTVLDTPELLADAIIDLMAYVTTYDKQVDMAFPVIKNAAGDRVEILVPQDAIDLLVNITHTKNVRSAYTENQYDLIAAEEDKWSKYSLADDYNPEEVEELP